MRILVLGDLHLPWVDYEALIATYKFSRSYKPDRIIQVGDLVDQKAWSQWPKDPDDPNPGEEWEMTEDGVHYVHKLFPEMTIIEGNHCRRIMKKAMEIGIPKKLIRGMNDMFPFPKWEWRLDPNPLVVDNIMFIHGDEMGGNAYQKAQRVGMNVVQGHDHQAYLQYINTFKHQVFGMSVGTLMDPNSIAARYAAKNAMKCWQGWATITDGVPQLYPWRG
jgi:predicted phosphodiesterase